MSDIYRERLCDVLRSAEDLYPNQIIPFTADDVDDICKLKVLVHIWMTIDLKAQFVNVKGNEGGTDVVDGDYRPTNVPANWHESGINNLDATYEYAGRTFDFTFTYNKRKDIYLITVVDNATRYSESAVINEVPGDCEEENSVEDEAIITDIMRQLYRRIDAFMEAVQSPDYKPRTHKSGSKKQKK